MSGSNENLAMSVKTFRSQNKVSATKKNSDSYVICDYCHMSGHLKEKCYCIHGYPSWHKFFGKPKPKPRFLTAKNSVVANVTQVSMPDSVMTTGGETVSAGLQMSQGNSLSGMNLIDSQCHQLIQMLQKSMTGGQAANTFAGDNSSSPWSTFHCANTVKHSVSQVYSITKDLPQCKWILDTGATDHITPFLSLMSDIQPSDAVLQLSNGETSGVTMWALCI